MSGTLFVEWLTELAPAFVTTLKVVVLTFLFATLLALPIALASLSRYKLLRGLAKTYTTLIRSIPSLTLLLLLYFALPSVGITLTAFVAAVVGLGLNGAAYVAEIYRSGIQAIGTGQREAAQMLGLRQSQVLRLVVLPQAMRIVVPPIGNFAIGLLKDTSVASLISVPEMMLQAKDLSSEYFMPLQIYLTTGAIYFVTAIILAVLFRCVEDALHLRSASQGKLTDAKI
jgi:His/Glu/Gln/Arg/opine family amino acid ABC transporter permease subunit